MALIDEPSDSDELRGALIDRRNVLSWRVNVAAVVFNTGFAILVIVTLFGIVFITKPNGVMHDIPPWAWLPLLIIMAPAQIYAQFLSWSAIAVGEMPTGPAIAVRQPRIPILLKAPIALLWLCNFCIGVGIVMSLSKPEPAPVAPAVPAIVEMMAIAFVVAIAFLLAFSANIYLLLATRTISASETLLERIWGVRIWIDLAMTISGWLYYRL
jgi:hypothetical protein